MKAVLSEFLGTFILSLVVICGIAAKNPPLAVPVLAALTLMFLVYLLGGISGAHINPGVSVGLWWHGKLPLNTMFQYLIAQFAGAMVARWFAGRFLKLTWNLVATQGISVTWGEIIGTAMLTMAVGFVVWGKVKEQLSGVIIGVGLFLGIVLAMNVSNGILNPAVALALKSASITYLLAPVLGGIIGIYISKYFYQEK